MKRLATMALSLCVLCTLSPALGAESGFSDVPDGAWYASCLETVCSAGLMQGTGPDTFSPEGTVTLGELVTAGLRLAHYTREGAAALSPAPAWYWADEEIGGTGLREALPGWLIDAFYYAGTLNQAPLNPGMTFQGMDLTTAWKAPADRYQLADALTWGLRYESAPEPVNDIPYLPDTGFYAALTLCRLGVLTGKDEYGAFHGEDTLTRAELAAALARCVDPALRVSFTPTPWPGWEGFSLTPIPIPEGYRPDFWWPDADSPEGYLLTGKLLILYPEEMESGAVYSADIRDSYGQPVRPSEDDQTRFQYDTFREAGHWGLRGPDGEPVIPAVYDHIGYWSEGLVPVETGGFWGFADLASGELVIPQRYYLPWEENESYYHLFEFHNGMAAVPQLQADGSMKVGAIDTKGEQVLPYDYEGLLYPSEGMIAFRRDGRYGYHDLESGQEFTIDRACAYQVDYDRLMGDFDLATVLYPFSEGYAPVYTEAMGYIDREGNPLTPALFDAAGPIVDGEAIVYISGQPYRLTLSE